MSQERAAARGRRGLVPSPTRLPDVWPETLPMQGEGEGEVSVAADSLEILQLAAAVNEMFHLYDGGDEANLLATDTFGGWLDHIETVLRGGGSGITFSSSGSSGVPKRCCHSAAHLLAETSFLADWLSDRRRIVAMAPAHHIYGFIFTALLPDHLGVDVWAAERASPADLARDLRAGDLVVGFPERWRWFERSLRHVAPGVTGVTSTAPCPEALIASLRDSGLARMIEVYGSSETAGIALRDDPGDPYALMPHWRFSDESREEAHELVHLSGLRADLPDRIVLTDDGRFRLAGRRDGAVQVGGVNVSPSAVAAQLAGRPGVREAAVRLMRPEEGSRLKAFVVPQPGVDVARLEADLLDWTRRNLTAAERPTMVTFGDNLPRSDLGKNADW
ncbi:AMP-binding protein [Lichenihabitans psoromatis]|uniref:AMP-binding protein n=1 Tax=Lichenihabitans psoromatis TaxID=2528642 RepID=UPI001035C1A8|nr:AMP-binding protein [Lichenihabitans psoromatis]